MAVWSVQWLGSWVNSGLAFLYPEVCQLCRHARATPAQSFVCSACRDRIRFIQPPFCARCGLPYEGAITNAFQCANCREGKLHFCSARSAVIARGEMLEIIHRYKYQRAFWFEPLLGELFSQQAKPELAAGKWDCIVPVPLHAAKQREREFNQAQRLASRLSLATDIPVTSNLLFRARPTQTQTRLTRAEREANVRNAFAMRPGARLNGERIVLVDDVFTTGATTSAAARVLRTAGASEVCVWTLARGI